MILLGCTTLGAQETIAKFKYEDAEKAFVAGNYQECIDNLDEVEKLLGKTAPNILHLKILAQHKLIEKKPLESFKKLQALHNDCATYLRDYDISGLEEKYRDVYEVQEGIKDYPKTLAEYTATLEKQKQEIKAIFEDYLNAIGGRQALGAVKSMFINGNKFINGHQSYFEEKHTATQVSHATYFVQKRNKKKLMFKMVSTQDTTFIVDSEGQKTIYGSEGSNPIKNYLFPEMYLTDQLDNPDFEFDLSKEENLITINIIYRNDEMGKLYSSSRSYDASTHLLKSVTTLSHPKTNTISASRSNGYSQIILADYKRVEGIYRPFKKTVFIKGGDEVQNGIADIGRSQESITKEKQTVSLSYGSIKSKTGQNSPSTTPKNSGPKKNSVIKEEYAIREILINQNVGPSDFEP
ncbi:hypothetical protein V1387_14690 [Allomuricauda taeanensis]|nr:hypothetical protein [Allomuricauda taeanensis]